MADMFAAMTDAITIVEVAARDGLQADPTDLAAATKVELIERLVAAGARRIEAASFVSPQAVPKMADGEAVMAGVPRAAGVVYSALALNARGAERAIAAGAHELTGVVPATDTFCARNQNATADECVGRWAEVGAAARAAGRRTSVVVSVAWGCPYEGDVAWPVVAEIVARLAATEPDELCLADTIGAAVPNRVGEWFSAAAGLVGPATALRGHFHNTRNTGLANIAAAVDAGVRIFDTSLGGVGGCPFAPRATGNTPTEDVVWMLERMGYRTGLDLTALIDTSAWFEAALGHPVPSLVAKAGPFPE
jgi:hydroxymethylglutaryl-CoA lyase